MSEPLSAPITKTALLQYAYYRSARSENQGSEPQICKRNRRKGLKCAAIFFLLSTFGLFNFSSYSSSVAFNLNVLAYKCEVDHSARETELGLNIKVQADKSK
jgi:hypothetical protein